MHVELAFPRSHPAFDGHFPGRPIVPAVALLAEVMAALEAATGRPAEQWSIANAKFVRPAGPGATLTLSIEERSFQIRGPDGIVATGRLEPAP